MLTYHLKLVKIFFFFQSVETESGTSPFPFDLDSALLSTTSNGPTTVCYVIKQYPVIDLYINPFIDYIFIYLYKSFYYDPFRGKESRQTHNIARCRAV